MFGRLPPHSPRATQPTDHGSQSDSTFAPTSLARPPRSVTIEDYLSQPTGALHPATLTPLSAGPDPPSSRLYYTQPNFGHYSAPSTSPTHSPNRPLLSRPSSSAGLQGLADAAMMEEAQSRRGSGDSLGDYRTLPPPVAPRPAYASHGRFWDDQLSNVRARADVSPPSLRYHLVVIMIRDHS